GRAAPGGCGAGPRLSGPDPAIVLRRHRGRSASLRSRSASRDARAARAVQLRHHQSRNSALLDRRRDDRGICADRDRRRGRAKRPYRLTAMSTPKASHQTSRGLAHAPALPVARDVHTYTQFGSTFEPWEYTDWLDESLSWKDTLFIGDWSPLEKMRVRGRDALKFFSTIAVNSFAKFDVGQAKHIILCNRAGKIMGE